jgi:hypothetical protein
METTGQPTKHEASDLTFLYDFVSECPNPNISEAMKELVARWMQHPKTVPHLKAAIKERLGLTNEEVLQVGWLLAINPHTPPSVLEDLCTSGSPELLERIAENRNAWPSTLATLSYQALAEIRIAAASNPSTPLASIMILVEDENPDVKFSMAENPDIPKEALEILSRDNNPYVKLRADKTLERVELEGKLQSDKDANILSDADPKKLSA